MAVQKSTGLKNQSLNSMFNSGAGGNFDSGVLEIRSGAAPGPDQAAGGTLLASIPVPADGFAAAAGGAIAKSGTWEDTAADAAGTAAHYRLRESGDAGGASTTARRIEGSVTLTGGGGDLTLDNTNLAIGQAVVITAFGFSE